MTVEQTNTVDFVSIESGTGDVLLTISDHLEWDLGEMDHLMLLQEKLNAYLRFIESGEITTKFPETRGKNYIINIVAKFPPTSQSINFIELAKKKIENAGFQLRFELFQAN